MAVSGFTLVDSDHMYKLCRVDLPFHGIVGGLSASGHHDVNEGTGVLCALPASGLRILPVLCKRGSFCEVF